jgi:protein-S-isoprenylcysteine O-methyltransferase Ste14
MDLKIIPVLQVVIALVFMYGIKWLLPEFNYAFSLSVILAQIFLLASIIIALLAIYCFKKHQTTVNPSKPESSTTLVNTGIYRYSRNPMYLAMVFSLLAFAVYLENSFSFPVIILFIWYMQKYQILPEERILKNIFSNQYLQYQASVRRWL